MRHSLSLIDENALTGVCSVCGPVELKSNYRGGWRCRNKFNENRKLGRASGTHKQYPQKPKDPVYDGERRSAIVARLLPLQDNKCAICKETFIASPCVDHDHDTGKVRGLLCKSCNLGIGYLRDNVSVMKNAVLYLS